MFRNTLLLSYFRNVKCCSGVQFAGSHYGNGRKNVCRPSLWVTAAKYHFAASVAAAKCLFCVRLHENIFIHFTGDNKINWFNTSVRFVFISDSKEHFRTSWNLAIGAYNVILV